MAELRQDDTENKITITLTIQEINVLKGFIDDEFMIRPPLGEGRKKKLAEILEKINNQYENGLKEIAIVESYKRTNPAKYYEINKVRKFLKAVINK